MKQLHKILLQIHNLLLFIQITGLLFNRESLCESTTWLNLLHNPAAGTACILACGTSKSRRPDNRTSIPTAPQDTLCINRPSRSCLSAFGMRRCRCCQSAFRRLRKPLLRLLRQATPIQSASVRLDGHVKHAVVQDRAFPAPDLARNQHTSAFGRDAHFVKPEPQSGMRLRPC